MDSEFERKILETLNNGLIRISDDLQQIQETLEKIANKK